MGAMEVINEHISSSEYSGIYLLGGDEKYLVSQYKTKLVQALVSAEDTMNYMVFKGEGAKVDKIADFALTMPFFADRRVALIEDSDFFKKGNEEMEKLLEELPETTVIIFVEDNIDKRNRLYKQAAKTGTVAMFETPDEKQLLMWVKSLFSRDEINIYDDAVYRLVEAVGTDMSKLFNEAEKLKSYCIEKGNVTVEDVDVLCVSEVEGKIFDMMDALSKRDKSTTMKLYDDLLLLREPAMRILFLITRQFNILLKVKCALSMECDKSKLAAFVKVPPFTVKKYISQCEGYTYEQLLDKVKKCQDADTNIKTGIMKDNMAVEMLIIDLLQE